MFDNGFADKIVGMEMVDDGLMRYEQGVILTQMGMLGLGMAEMQMGEMQMVQGNVLMDVGMIKGGMRMGYGPGYGAMSVVAVQQALLLAQTRYACMGVGCTYPCCVRRCGPGCILPCCRKEVLVGFNQQYNKPVVYTQQQGYLSEQFQKKKMYVQNKVFNQQALKPIFTGSIYKQQLLNWQFIQNGFVTNHHFMNQRLSSIIKVKVKREILYFDCLFLKTTHLNSVDHYYAVPRHQQANWFCSIIWAKLQLQRYGCDLHHQFNGFIKGRVLRKSKYFGEWAFRQIVIDDEGLKSYRNPNKDPTTRITRIAELWTRFELIDGQMYLVIKLHFEGIKYEYGVPLQNAIHWIRAFFYLMR